MVSEEELEKKYEEYEKMRQAYLLIEAQRSKILQDLDEIENALKELNNLSEGQKVYLLVGNVLIEKDKKELIDRLNEEKEIFKIKSESLKKQSDLYREKLNSLAKELEELLKKANLSTK